MIKHNLARFWIELFFGLLFFVLLYRAPFSERTLIPNFEPYPDSFHYLIPAQHLLQGKGMTMDRIGKILPGVPPLYSLTFLPFFSLNTDPRMAYFANLSLSLLSYVFFVAICRRICTSRPIRALLYLLFVTHPVFVWYVELVMAEHLALLLFLIGIWLFTRRGGNRQRFIEGIVSPLMYATKYAAAPISFAFLLIFGLRALARSVKTKKISPVLMFVLGAILSTGVYLAMTHAIRGSSELNRVFAVFQSRVTSAGGENQAPAAAPNDPFFSTKYVRHNLTEYGNYLIGRPLLILWKTERLLPMPFALLGIVGWVLAWRRKEKWLAAAAMCIVGATLGFLSLFYVVDGRYVYHFIPLAIIGVGFSLQFVRDHCRRPRSVMIFFLFLLALFTLYTIQNARRLKFRASLNLRHAETPWYYKAVRDTDMYLAAQPMSEKLPVVISPMPPFLFDFYAKTPMLLLPLHRYQEFRNATTQTWGEHDYTNLHAVYDQYLAQGHKVYLTSYGVGNEKYLQNEFELIKQEFAGELVKEGCHGLCTIYQLKRTSK